MSLGCKLDTAPKKPTNYTLIIVPVLIVIAIGACIGLASTGIYQLATGSPIFSLASSTTGGNSVSGMLISSLDARNGSRHGITYW